METFTQHRNHIQLDLSIHATISTQSTNEMLASVTVDMKSTDTKLDLLINLRSPREQDLMTFVEENGGAEKFMRDKGLMKELFERSDSARVDRDRKISSATVQAKFMAEITSEAKKGLNIILQENQSVFLHKFEAQKNEIKAIVRSESDRVIGAVLAGPHSRIVDPV